MILQQQMVVEAWKSSFRKINDDIYSFNTIKPQVDAWLEEHMYLPGNTTVKPGFYSFDFTPYMRRWVNILHPSDPTRYFSIMKDGQSGFTTALVIGGMLYIISESPTTILFTAGDINLAQKTIEERFDPVIRASGLDQLIRSNVVKKTNNRTGDTSKKKEYLNGNMTIAGTNSANTFRMFSAQIGLHDDWDTAPKEIGKEGSTRMVMKTRQNSYGDRAKSGYISTPTITQTSNIWEVVQLGTMEYWNWVCPGCKCHFPILWQVEAGKNVDGMVIIPADAAEKGEMAYYEDRLANMAGIVWLMDERNRFVDGSARYKCQHCGHLITENLKFDLNLAGADWIATVPEPVEKNHVSGIKNFIYNFPGADGWETGILEWLAACPPGGTVDVLKLKTFNNLRLGMPFAEMGESPRVNELMSNTRSYIPGLVPDATCEADGNGKIILLTMSCDINGLYNTEAEDVRLDWELLAHSSTGATYSVDHGSIGTFKRIHERSKKEKAEDDARFKWTLTHGSMAMDDNNIRVNNSVWPVFEELLMKEWPLESSKLKVESEKLEAKGDNDLEGRYVDITLMDTGHGEKPVTQFVVEMQGKGLLCFGVKGRVEGYRPLKRESSSIMRSPEKPKQLYIVEVNQVKDDLSEYMKLRVGDDGSQPSGFMNFPQSRDGKYQMESFFRHYEGERRVAEKKNNEVVGYKWVKKNNSVANHFWDVRVYGLAAPFVWLDLLKRRNAKYKNYTWEDLVADLS
jgi:phage terminase large subunit GpA-like protein